MQRFHRVFVILVTVLVSTGICGCGSSGTLSRDVSSSQKTAETVIGISFPTMQLAYRAKMRDLVQTAYPEGNDKGIRLIIKDADGSQTRQNQDIMDLVDLNVDGIVLIPYTTEGPVSAVRYANERGIPVITVDNTLEADSGAEVISYVGADHREMGREAAELLLQILEEKLPDRDQWNVIEFAGSPGASGTIDREYGINAVLGSNHKINMLATYNAEFMTKNAKSVMDDCLKVYDSIDAVICQNDLMALGCYYSLREAGKLGRIVIVGIDGQRDVVEKMVSGGIDGTVFQNPDMILTGIEKLTDYLSGETILPLYYQPTYIIEKADAQKYLINALPW